MPLRNVTLGKSEHPQSTPIIFNRFYNVMPPGLIVQVTTKINAIKANVTVDFQLTTGIIVSLARQLQV